MDKLTLKNPPLKEKKRARWSKSIEVNGVTKSISVKEVENGFVIEQCMYGRDTTKKDSDYVDISKTYVSKTNPLEGKEEDKEEQSDEFSLKGLDTLIIE